MLPPANAAGAGIDVYDEMLGSGAKRGWWQAGRARKSGGQEVSRDLATGATQPLTLIMPLLLTQFESEQRAGASAVPLWAAGGLMLQ